MTEAFFAKRDPKRTQQATLCFLVEGEDGKVKKVLLGMKKRGFGKGKWNGFGGKIEEKETLEAAAVREMKEEVGVVAKSLEKVGVLHFYFPDEREKREWNQDVHVFLCRQWQGRPAESEEMLPRWFKTEKIPFKAMWDDDVYWLPEVLAGKKIEGWFSFDEKNKTTGYKVKTQ